MEHAFETMKPNRHKWTQISEDWFLMVGKTDSTISTLRLSFNPDNFLSSVPEGDYQAEQDKSDMIVLLEGATYPYGYIPIYRDTKSLCLIMKRNRELSDESLKAATKHTLSADEYAKVVERLEANLAKVFDRVRMTEGDHG